MKGLTFDLVDLERRTRQLPAGPAGRSSADARRQPRARLGDRPGGVFLRRIDQIADEDQLLLQAVARVVMDGDARQPREQLTGPPRRPSSSRSKRRLARAARRRTHGTQPAPPRRAASTARVAVQRARRLRRRRPRVRRSRRARGAALPPAPWVNVVAQPDVRLRRLGASGCGFTWSENSHENRLTPWRNDPVRDPPGEALFIRDERDRQALVADAAAGGRRPALHDPSHGTGYTHLRARARRHRARC